MSDLVLYLCVTLTTSFICSLSEATILSITPAFTALLEKKGRRSGRLLDRLQTNIDMPLAAILTFNTIANTVGAMLIAREVQHIWGDAVIATASAGLTFVILIFAEILPKTVGAIYAKKLAPFVAYLVTGLVYVTLPVVYISRFFNSLFSQKVFRGMSREEVIATAEIGADEGVIHQKESKIIKNLLMLDKVKVSEIMTPRSVVNCFDMNATVGAIMDKYKPVRFSRIPLFEGNIDNVRGLLHRYKLMEAVSHDMYNMPLRDIMTSIHTVSEEMHVSLALDEFIKRREHLFLVVNEYGTMSGIVTLEDAIETLLGVEIVDEYDSVTDMRQYALEQWRLKKQALLKK
jgi:CBS domain containing-hemolysin-like protein